MRIYYRATFLMATFFLAIFQVQAQGDQEILLTGQLDNCGPQLKLYTFMGLGFKEIAQVPLGADGDFRIAINSPEQPAYIYIGQDTRLVRPLLISSSEDSIYLQGKCPDLRSAKLSNSPLNDSYELLKQKISYFKQQMGRTNYLVPRKAGAEKQQLLDKLADLDQEQLELLDSLKESDPFLANIFSINVFLSFWHNRGDYPNDLTYFANEYFKYADFGQPQLQQSPWVYEGFKTYVKTLAGARLPEEQFRQVVDRALGRTPKGSGAHMLALSGVLTGLRESSNPNFEYYAMRFIEQFGEQYPDAVASLNAVLKEMRRLMVGGEAPDFEQKTPEGETLQLSDLRGKVVLLDFWASWCGPCRRENPNVVRLYNEYKDQGFTVLGVSLDRDKQKWVNAIAKDGLEWHHVSDLRGWSNVVAQQYKVSSIPHTFLLDREGKIIGVKLRGRALENKLEELFGTP